MTATVDTGKRQYRMGLRAQRKEATAERIRHEAWERFSTRPFDDVTLAEVAAAAEVTVPTLLAHFGRKEELFVAAYTEWAGRAARLRDEAVPGDDAGVVANVLTHYERDGDRILLLLAQEERIDAVRHVTDRGRTFHRAWVERTFEPRLRELRGAARERLVNQLVVATDVLTWKLLRRDMGLSRPDAERTLLGMVRSLSAGGGG